MSFAVATSIEEAVTAMAQGAQPIAGGTDMVVGARQGKAPLPEHVIAIDRIPELQSINETETELIIGAGVTHAALMTDPLIVKYVPSIADGAALVGSPSTRNVGTIGGNIMNGSPAMDTGAPLMTSNSRARLRSSSGTRMVSMQELWIGPGRLTASPDELCVAIHLPKPVPAAGCAYVRLEYRRAMEIAIVGAAASVATNESGTLSSLSVALTAVAPTILEVTGTASLIGATIDDALLDKVAELSSAQAAPISDMRASDAYRRHTVGVMARRATDAALRRAAGEDIPAPVNRAVGIGAAQ